MSRKFKFHLISKNNWYFTWKPIYIFLSYLAQFFWEWEMFQTYSVEQFKTHILYSVTLFENRAVYAIRWKNIARLGWPQMTIGRKRISCWIPKRARTHTHRHTHTHSQYVILILFSLQQCFHEGAWLLRYIYIACFVFKFVRIRGSCRKAEWTRSTTQYSEAAEKPPPPLSRFFSYICYPW